MPSITLESLADQVATLQLAVNELLSRVRGPAVNPAPADPSDVLPDPIPGEGIAAYAARCGQYVGGEKGEQAIRASGSLFLTGGPLVRKHNGSWKKAVWEFIWGDPNYTPDPRWASYRPG